MIDGNVDSITINASGRQSCTPSLSSVSKIKEGSKTAYRSLMTYSYSPCDIHMKFSLAISGYLLYFERLTLNILVPRGANSDRKGSHWPSHVFERRSWIKTEYPFCPNLNAVWQHWVTIKSQGCIHLQALHNEFNNNNVLPKYSAECFFFPHY